jgi:hypothetical protein
MHVNSILEECPNSCGQAFDILGFNIIVAEGDCEAEQ